MDKKKSFDHDQNSYPLCYPLPGQVNNHDNNGNDDRGDSHILHVQRSLSILMQ